MGVVDGLRDIFWVIKGALKTISHSNLLLHGSIRETSLINKLEMVLAGGKPTGIIYLDVAGFHEVQFLYGTVGAARVLALVEKNLRDKITRFFPRADIQAVENLWADDFIILFTLPALVSQEKLLELVVALRLAIKDSLNPEFLRLVGKELELHAGYAMIETDSDLKTEVKLYMALKEAQKIARGTLDLHTLKLTKEFKELLTERRLTVVYQPILSFQTGEILGWEALARGPANSYFRSPDVIFSFAEEIGLLYPTERVCRLQAISNINGLVPDQKLFLNVHPRTVSDPTFVKGETLGLLQAYGLTPRNVVFEITERHSIKDYGLLKRTLEHYRNQGYQVAVDDVGAGFSGLYSIAEIRPEFIKIDMALVRDIDSNPARRAVVEALMTLASKLNCLVIAEGIETQNELNTLLAMGIHYGQGYLLARPAFPKPLVAGKLVAHIRRQGGRNGDRGWWRGLTIGDLVTPTMVVDESMPVAEVKEKLAATRQPLGGLVVVKEGVPVGLVMRHNLDRLLSSRYGVSLYSHRPVKAVMDPAPMIINSSTPLEQASEMAMKREQEKLYDDLVVTEDGKLIGTVPVQRMLDTLARLQIELARGANPLTGLPGNVAIEGELAAKSKAGQAFSIIYADLDGFKAYNDAYGFENGDRMIIMLANIIVHAVKKYGAEVDFVGHIGGDDFIVISSPEYTEGICKAIVRLFDRLVGRLFSDEDRNQGKFYSQDREGRRTWLPLVSVSLAIVDCRDAEDYRDLATRAAQLKKYAKSLPGSVYVRDRRT
ncbi:bifunctional diguanylate cyclase/phosphodiesterase [Neomoorella thermoacetica]|uniref:bifunctional diguanylate cyclase/phosphodiesterase n=1 Tax=Neomoorella thermoacetica TaxID=1525 RepID=UPI0008FB167E|nr:bifunctional diguanylate cyclase/phosphodiesterase [Moorella thermoacetica]APC08629.1 phytochrome-like protein cph2 [Moorella thermoacetica]